MAKSKAFALMTVITSIFLFAMVHQRISMMVRVTGALSSIANVLAETPLHEFYLCRFVEEVLKHPRSPGIFAAQLLIGTLVYTALGRVLSASRTSSKIGAEAVDTTSLAHATYRKSWSYWPDGKALADRLPVIQRIEREHSGGGPNPKQPFMNGTYTIGAFGRAKMAFVAVTLFPVRIGIFLIGALGMAIFPSLSMLGMTPAQLKEPFSPLRAMVRSVVYPSFRLCIFALGFHWIATDGAKRATYEEAPLIIPNHRTFSDMTIGYLFGATGVSKAENIKNPLVTFAFKAMQVLLVDRDSSTSREKTKAELKKRVSSGGKYLQTIIFPEGTCSNGSTVLSFKAGAFALGVPVQPVAVRYGWRGWDPSLVRGGASLPLLLFGLMTQFHNSMRVTYLPVYTPSKAELSDAVLFANNVRATIANELGLATPLGEHSYYDVMLIDYAWKKLKLPALSIDLEFKKVRAEFSAGAFDPGRALELLKRFGAIDAKRRGRITAEDVLELNETEPSSSSTVDPSERFAIVRAAIAEVDSVGCGEREGGIGCSVNFRDFAVLCMLLESARKKNGPPALTARKEDARVAKEAGEMLDRIAAATGASKKTVAGLLVAALEGERR